MAPKINKASILIAEDDRSIRDLLLHTLSDHYQVEMVKTGPEAIRVISETKPDLVLLDVSLPGLSGYEVCRAVRLDPALRFVKIVFLSGSTGIEDRLAGYEAGGDEYISKPFEKLELLAKLRVMFRLKTVEEVNQLKTDFLMLISHETQTPITVIKGMCDCLMDVEDLSAAESKHMVKRIYAAMQRLSRLAEKTLLACKLRDTQTLSLLPLQVDDLIDMIKEDLEENCEENHVSLSVEGVGSSVLGSKGLLTSALSFVIENAIKFSPKDGTVRIVQSNTEHGSEVRISDDGCGITEDRLESIFDLFSIKDIMHHSAGLGLSLALARRITELHHGTLTAERNRNSGATLVFNFPRLAAPAEAEIVHLS